MSKVGSSSDYYFQDVDNTERHEHSETLSPEDLGLEFVKTQNYSITVSNVEIRNIGTPEKGDSQVQKFSKLILAYLKRYMR